MTRVEFGLPRASPRSCGIGSTHFVAGWHIRRPEPVFSFVRFSFTYVGSLHQSLFRFLCCHFVAVIFLHCVPKKRDHVFNDMLNRPFTKLFATLTTQAIDKCFYFSTLPTKTWSYGRKPAYSRPCNGWRK